MEGGIKIDRKIMDNPLYLSEPFTRMQAWIDLLLLANHKEGFFYVRGNKVVVGRGQVGTSSRTLASRWQWSRGKVERFLKDLENDNQIEPQKNNVITLISICNYDDYQNTEPQTEPQTSRRQTTDEPQTDRNKNDKNDKNEKKEKKEIKETISKDIVQKKVDAKASTLTRRDEFYKSLIPFLSTYGKDMIRDFFDYWSEQNKSGTQMRFEKQPTWEVAKRLATWNKRDTFKNQNNNKSYEQTATRTRKKLY